MSHISRVLAICVFVMSLALPSTSKADDPALPAQDVAPTGLEGQPLFDQVDPASGAMVQRYRFALPPARGLNGPELSLVYNSSTRDREAGYGWGLDLPAIELRPISGIPRDAVDVWPPNPRYLFSGQPLVRICTVGGECPNEPSTSGHADWATGWTYFRLQTESIFARLYLSADALTWRVQFKGGEILELGRPIGENFGVADAIERKNGSTVRWRPVVRRDLQHPNNLIVYRWQFLGARGIAFLTDIYDTPSLATPTNLGAFAHHTQLDWQTLPYLSGNRQGPERAAPDMRLVRVASASESWSASTAREVYSSYSLIYYLQRDTSYDPTTQGPLFHHSFLHQLQRFGRCTETESSDGRIPIPLQSQSCGQLPTIAFEYSRGVADFAASLSTVNSGPANAADQFKVLLDPSTAAIVDFDRDGLPDVVQGWPSQCPNAAFNREVAVRDHGDTGEPELWCLKSQHNGEDNPDSTEYSIRSARPMLGYSNSGKSGTSAGLFTYQCMDTGPLEQANSIVALSAGPPADQREHLAEFLNPRANTSLGAFGSTLGIWGNNRYLPFYARSLEQPAFSPGGEPPSFALGGCAMDRTFSSSAFYPRWRWESGPIESWTLPVARTQTQNPPPEAFVDIDGDGYTDVLERVVDGPIPPQYFDDARVRFTRKYGVGDSAPQASGAVAGPAVVPFVDSDGTRVNSLMPIKTTEGGASYFYVDMNGDGLPDLVTLSRVNEAYSLRIRPGDGTGLFTCNSADPWACTLEYDNTQYPQFSSSYYEPTVPAGNVPWALASYMGISDYPTAFYVHDVNGDGLADFIRVGAPGTPGVVEVWTNLDGQNFACAGAGSSCAIGSIYDPVHARNLGPTDNYRITFADMDADGVDDIVALATQGVLWGSVLKVNPRDLSASGSRPGQLVRIDDNAGAATRISYSTVQALDLASRATSKPWTFHSPIPQAVVTQVLKNDTATSNGGSQGAPYAFSRKVKYTYRDPAYDGWSRTPVGFRKVATQVGSEQAITETTFWFGACESNAIPSTVGGVSSTSLCPFGTDDEFASSSPTYRSWVGKPVRTDRYIPAFEVQGLPYQLLWSRFNEYAPPAVLLSPYNERSVTYSYVKHSETHLYHPEQSVSPGASTTPQAGGDAIEAPPTQSGAKVLETFYTVDTNGNLLESKDLGDPAESADHPRIQQSSELPFGLALYLTCDANWRCLPSFQTTAEDAGGSVVARRRVRLIHDSTTGDLREVMAYLETNHSLVRGSSEVTSFSTGPSTMALAGWISQAKYEYSAEGVIVLAQGAGSDGSATKSCTRTTLDDKYGQFPKLISVYRDGCDSAFHLDTTLSFDRFYGKVTTRVAPDLGTSVVELDAFGRQLNVYAPTNDHTLLTTKVAHFSYGDSGPLPWVDTQTFTGQGETGGIRSVTIMNGLHEPVMQMTQGDGAGWIVTNRTTRDESGRPLDTYRPSASPISTDPTVIASLATWFSPPSNGYIFAGYDGFGRLSTVQEDAVPQLKRIYDPLAITSFDAEQIPGGAGSHIGGSTRVELTARGQIRRTKENTATAGTITTETTFDVLGQPKSIAKSGTTDSAHLTRQIGWDSLGRMVRNLEPNSSDIAQGVGWAYAWDENNRLVGTSDARGCGKDIYYDGLGRVRGEDWSPCLATPSQAAYTAPNLTTGEGLEVLNRYDDYEPDQTESDAEFFDDPGLAIGRLVSTVDRGSHTRFNYDNRGRIRRIARQVAKPLSEQAVGTDPIAPHWYSSRSDFDNANRITTRTSGADEGVFSIGGGTFESYTYSPRGLLSDISSNQHGGIINNITYDASNHPTLVTYGDRAQTTSELEYDSQERLTAQRTSRSAPSLWSTASANYTVPSADTTQTELANLKVADFDLVGNPTDLSDTSSPVVAGQSAFNPQRARIIEYDDNYRVTSATYHYSSGSGTAAFQSPFAAEVSAGDNTPFPLQTQLTTRIKNESFAYDSLGNTISTTDDKNATYDRSLGVVTNGDGATAGPNQLTGANGTSARYDRAGNLIELKVSRTGTCPSGGSSKCGQWLAYDWDEVGQLARARRWDFASTVPDLGAGVLPSESPSWDLHYAYSGGQRVVKSALDASGVERHTLEIFSTLRLDHDTFLPATGDYERSSLATHVYLAGGLANVFDDGGALPTPPGTPPTRLFLNFGDMLGSSAVTIDHTTSEVVERAAYTAYGNIESDYRPNRWGAAREPYKFTGKEEDIEVSAVYFGARYYNPRLGRFLSPDPLTIHGFASDLNPYAYVHGRALRSVDPWGLAEPNADGSGDGTDSSGVNLPENVDSPALSSSSEAAAELLAVGQALLRELWLGTGVGSLANAYAESTDASRPPSVDTTADGVLAGAWNAIPGVNGPLSVPSLVLGAYPMPEENSTGYAIGAGATQLGALLLPALVPGPSPAAAAETGPGQSAGIRAAIEEGTGESLAGNEFFLHGTTAERAADFELEAGRQLYTTTNPSLARLFGERTVAKAGGGKVGGVAIVLPRTAVGQLRSLGQLTVRPISDMPQHLEWVFSPGARDTILQQGSIITLPPGAL